jgi:hypothetical protein
MVGVSLFSSGGIGDLALKKVVLMLLWLMNS